MRIGVAISSLILAGCLVAQPDTCDRLPSKTPNDINALAKTGLELSHASEYKAAAACYRKILAIDPNIPQIQLNLGLAEFKTGRFREAIPPFEATLKLDPNNKQAPALLAMSYYGSRMFKEAAAKLEIALDSDPENTQLHYYFAQSLLSSSQYQRALPEFQWLARHDPDNAATHVLLAEALDGLSRPDEAIQELEAALAKSPNEPNVHFDIGYIYWAQQKDDEAEREFRLELDRDPSHAHACAWLADILIRRNDFEKAKPLLDQALSLEPNLRVAHLDLGIYFAHQKLYNRAIQEFQEAIRLDGSKTDAHFRLARVYQEAGKSAEAGAELAIVRQLSQQKKESLEKVTGHVPALEPDK